MLRVEILRVQVTLQTTLHRMAGDGELQKLRENMLGTDMWYWSDA
jgi:hypothetical protein